MTMFMKRKSDNDDEDEDGDFSSRNKRILRTDSDKNENVKSSEKVNVLAQFCSESGEDAGPPIELPVTLPKDKMEKILNTFLNETEPTPYNFFVNDEEVKGDLKSAVDKITLNEEKVLKILYQPQAVFKVRAVTRCSSSLQGHAQVILHASFSPCGQFLASGSGDTTVRFWDVKTETPHFTCTGHRLEVLVTAWSPDGERLATACAAGRIIVWNPITGKQMGKTMGIMMKSDKRKKVMNETVKALNWEPLHLTEDGVSIRLASGTKDGIVRIWNTIHGTNMVVGNHNKGIRALRWGGEGLLYSASEDGKIKVWRTSDGVLCRTLESHGHWVNTLALNTDYVLRTGAFDPRNLMKASPEFSKREERKEKALKRYKEALMTAGEEERLVSGSDDMTLFFWVPSKSKKPFVHMTGHQQIVNDVKFSPDTRLVASASFDKSVRLWSGLNGKFICVFRGHVNSVYQLSWSADSRLLLSGSKDSTLKVWNIANRKLEIELPGHADEVYTVDWSPDGEKVVSGGKDKILKIGRTKKHRMQTRRNHNYRSNGQRDLS